MERTYLKLTMFSALLIWDENIRNQGGTEGLLQEVFLRGWAVFSPRDFYQSSQTRQELMNLRFLQVKKVWEIMVKSPESAD